MAKKKKQCNTAKSQKNTPAPQQHAPRLKETLSDMLSPKTADRALIIGGVIVIVISVVIRIIMFTKDRSLWLDEAMFAVNISGRTWLELLVPPLSNGQSAPALYTVIVKLFADIFGYNEFSMRFFSLLAFLGFVPVFFIFLKKAFNMTNAVASLFTAIAALLPTYFWYSNEAKPYMGDAFFAVLITLLYGRYREKKLKLPILTALYILFLTLSSPAIFFVGGALLCEFIIACIGKDKKQIIKIFTAGTTVVAVFGIYYLWWLSPAREFMQSYWGDGTTSWSERYNLISNIFKPTTTRNHDSSFLWWFVPFSLAGVFFSCRAKNVAAIASALSLTLVIVASYIGMWPANERLWLFLPAFVLAFAGYAVNFIGDYANKLKSTKTKRAKVFYISNAVMTLALCIVIVFFTKDAFEFTGDRAYMINQEINPLISYLRENIRDGEVVYLWPASVAAFDFKNNFSRRIGNVTQDNVFVLDVDDNVNTDFIVQYEKVYLLFTHFSHHINFNDFYSFLTQFGNLSLMNVHHTPLILFERDENLLERLTELQAAQASRENE